MYDPKLTFLEYELEYRTDQLKSGLAQNRKHHRRLPWARRHTAVADHAR
jgi:hypothetical protein